MKKIGIYKITSPSGKVYIGQSININERWSIYYRVQCKPQPKLYNSLKKYNVRSHIFEIIEECLIERLDEREVYWKLHYLEQVNYNWNKVLFCELFDTGGGPRSEEIKQKISKTSTGQKRSKETCDKISKSKIGHKGNLGRIQSKETKQKISNALKGSVRSQETKDKQSKSLMGKIVSEETKQKMSLSALGKPKSEAHKQNIRNNRNNIIIGVKLANSKPILQYDLEGNFIKEWESITEAKKWLGKGDITGCLSGKQKTAGKYKWKYKI